MLHVVTEDPLAKELIADRYQMIGVIGEGGWSTVYKAKDTKLNRMVAVKLLHKHLVSSADKVRRFQQEAESAAQLAHNNVVVTYDYGMLGDGQPYIVMEFLQGRSLNTILAEEDRLAHQKVIAYMLPLCEGMHAAHEKGLVHRDLKPGNIFVTRNAQGDDVVKVVDFGLAKVVETGQGMPSAHLTETGATLGTPAYMSPEQCMGRPLDRRSDIYAIGCIMYEALAGEKPFKGETPFDCMLKHLNEPPESFSNFPSPISVPPSLERAIFRCLAKDPQHRFQTARELATELHRAALEDCATPLGQSVISRIITPHPQIKMTAITAVLATLVVSLGGFLVYKTIGDAGVKLPEEDRKRAVRTTLKPLADVFDETSLSIIDSKRITDEVLAEGLKTYSGYQDLDLSESKVSDKGVALLRQAPRLKTLVLHQSYKVTDKAMDDVAQIPSLVELDLRGTEVTDKGIAKLGALPLLESIWLSGKGITDESCKTLGKIKTLKLLQLDGTMIGDPGVEALKPLKHLKQLRLDRTRVTNKALGTIGGFTELNRLNLGRTGITDTGLRQLSGLSALRQLSVDHTKITDKGVSELAKLPEVNDLGISGCGLNDKSAAILGTMHKMELLNVMDNPISDTGLKHFENLHSLMKLNIIGCQITKGAARRLDDSLSHCKVESSFNKETR